jgi:3-oxoacyl-[acyl-carrier-protein] synthase-3
VTGASPCARARGVHPPGIRAISYAFPSGRKTLPELEREGLLESSAELLGRFGFASVHVAERESPFDLAQAAARRLLDENQIDPLSVDLLIYAGPQGPTAFSTRPSDAECVAGVRAQGRFRYPGTRLQHALGLDAAAVFGMDQLACTTLFSAVRVAVSLCASEQLERVLCVSSEFYPADAGREAIFNCTSDAAVALLVDRSAERNYVRASSQVTKGFYWDAPALKNEIVASYFPTFKHVVEETLRRAGWQRSDVDIVLPHNVSRRSWDILLRLVELPPSRLWDRNIARHGHTLAGDNFINLSDALASGDARPGDKALLFSYGYGAHWCGLALEV